MASKKSIYSGLLLLTLTLGAFVPVTSFADDGIATNDAVLTQPTTDRVATGPSIASIISRRVDAAFESRLAVGSSASTNFGLDASALATATLCCCPPDSFEGRLLILSPSPTAFSRPIVLSSLLSRGHF